MKATATRETANSSGGSSNFHQGTVASLSKRAPHPISSLDLSPDRNHAVLASKDTLQIIKISPNGISLIKAIPIAQHFQASRFGEDSSTRTTTNPLFGQHHHHKASNVVITKVAWSRTGLIAAAGSNGVIVVYSLDNNAEAVLSQHVRAVNGLAWHPTRDGLLLSASHDATVLLWERLEETVQADHAKSSKGLHHRLFGVAQSMTNSTRKNNMTWHCRAKFEPKSEAVRDIQWSPFYEDGT
jgi:WD40 repeat protein